MINKFNLSIFLQYWNEDKKVYRNKKKQFKVSKFKVQMFFKSSNVFPNEL